MGGNLHYTLKQNDVLNLCAEFGQVEHVQIWYDKNGYPTGCASVTLNDSDDAIKVFQGLHGKKVKNLTICTAFTKIQSMKKNIVNKLNQQNKSLKKKLVQSKKIQKKVVKVEKMEVEKNENKGKKGKRVKGRRDGVGFGGRKGNNSNKAFSKKWVLEEVVKEEEAAEQE